MANALLEILTSRPQNMLGSGMASDAAAILQSRPYQLHLQEAKALGQTPMTPEQFAQAQRGQ